MDDWNFLSGTLVVEVTSAVPERTLDAILQNRITIAKVTQVNELTYRFVIRRKDRIPLESLVNHMGGKLIILEKRGLYWKLRSLYHRPVLWSLAILMVISCIFLPTRIFFIRVEGNRLLPVGQILDAAEHCGIRFGSSRRLVRSEKVKNELLAKLPQLQWAGVNTAGCTAMISVRERSEEKQASKKAFGNLIASRDGYILSQVILNGTPMFETGDAVTKDQILVSGYTDCGICIRAVRAEGEILAQTSRKLTAVTPKMTASVVDVTDRKYKISLLIRKKRINLWKDSRISDTGCGRMYEEYFVSLPGGFQLPVAICVDQYLEYSISEDTLPAETVQMQLQDFSDRYLLQQTVSGQILQKQQHFQECDGFYLLSSQYTCSEMIGKEQEEQIGEINEQGD